LRSEGVVATSREVTLVFLPRYPVSITVDRRESLIDAYEDLLAAYDQIVARGRSRS